MSSIAVRIAPFSQKATIAQFSFLFAQLKFMWFFLFIDQIHMTLP